MGYANGGILFYIILSIFISVLISTKDLISRHTWSNPDFAVLSALNRDQYNRKTSNENTQYSLISLNCFEIIMMINRKGRRF